MAGTKMELRRYGSETLRWKEQYIEVDQNFISTNNGLYITLTHPYELGSNLLDVYFNGHRLNVGSGYVEIDEYTILLDLGVYPSTHSLAGQPVQLEIGDEIYIRTWNKEYMGSGSDGQVIKDLEEEIVQARQYKPSDTPFNKLDDRLDYIQERVELKTIIMVLTKVSVGASHFEIPFPHAGEIIEVYASCATAGSTDTIIKVEKCSQGDYDSTPIWTNILSPDLTIDANEKSSNTSTSPHSISVTGVDQNDHFRLNVVEAGNGAKGVTVKVSVLIR